MSQHTPPASEPSDGATSDDLSDGDLNDGSIGHDLALVFGALAYGADLNVEVTEFTRLLAALERWMPGTDADERVEVAFGAISLFVDAPDRTGVLLDALRRLYDVLSAEEREQALEDAVAIAEADGRLLGSERVFIETVAEAWHLRLRADKRLARTTASVREWTSLHDVALVLVAVAHSSDAVLDGAEVDSIREAVAGWNPAASADAIEDVLRVVLERYQEAPTAVEPSIERLAASLSLLERLALVSDLLGVAGSDGEVSAEERAAIDALKQALGLGRYTKTSGDATD